MSLWPYSVYCVVYLYLFKVYDSRVVPCLPVDDIQVINKCQRVIVQAEMVTLI